jgi:hypothetical protein
MEIMVTTDTKDKYGEFILCNEDQTTDKGKNYSIQKMYDIEQRESKDQFVDFIKEQMEMDACKGKSVNVFISNINSDIDTEFKVMDVEIPWYHQDSLAIKDVETHIVTAIRNKIEGMKAVIRDIQDDFGIVDGVRMPNDLINQKYTDEIHKKDTNWIRFRLVFINMIVSGQFLASYSMYAFYTLLIFGISSFLKPTCMFNTFMGFLYECTHAMPFLKLIDAIYIGRHEKNLKQEEECWRMLQDILRCPELVKAIAGSNARGACDPQLDGLDKETKDKLEELDKLEQLGFEVGDLKKEILTKVKKTNTDLDHRYPINYDK